jgi:hypothetical protein
MVRRLVSAGLRLSFLRLAEDERQLPCGDKFKKYVVHLDSGFAFHCTCSTSFFCFIDAASRS